MNGPSVSGHASGSSIEARTDLPGEASSAAEARHFVADHLARAGLDALSDTAVLLTSELVANAVLHAHTDLVLALRVEPRRVIVEVHDGATAAPAPKHYSTLSGTGRGLVLVEALADRWGVESTHAGKFVWFELGRDSGEAR